MSGTRDHCANLKKIFVYETKSMTASESGLQRLKSEKSVTEKTPGLLKGTFCRKELRRKTNLMKKNPATHPTVAICIHVRKIHLILALPTV